MIISSTVKTQNSPLFGKPYTLDTLADSLYIELRQGVSVYSEFRSHAGDLFLVDLDKDGNMIGVTIDNFLEQGRKLGLKSWLQITWLKLLETSLPVRAWAYASQRYAVSVVTNILSNKRDLDLLPQALGA